MKILGIDTTTKMLCVGVYDDGKACEYNVELGRKHSALVVTTVKRVLDALRWQAKDLDYFVCGAGPGSFTGVRIGAAAIKGLAWSLKKPIVSVSSLDILAGNASCEGTIVPAIDAKRGLIYSSIYENKNGKLKRLAPYMLLPAEEFLKKIKPGSVIFGDALLLYKEEILKRVKEVSFLDKDYWRLRGGNIIAPALEKIREGRLNTAFDIQPIYLYPKECQIKNA